MLAKRRHECVVVDIHKSTPHWICVSVFCGVDPFPPSRGGGGGGLTPTNWLPSD